jgi:ketosteroid isomerase-like protein
MTDPQLTGQDALTRAEHPNVTLVNEAHERLERGDMAAISEMFADDITWHEFGSSPLAGTYVGRDEVMKFWRRYFTAAGPDFTQDIVSVMANDDFVTSIVELTGIKPSTGLSQTAADVMRIADGRIAEFWRYYADLKEASDFFAAAP